MLACGWPRAEASPQKFGKEGPIGVRRGEAAPRPFAAGTAQEGGDVDRIPPENPGRSAVERSLRFGVLFPLADPS